MQCSECGSGSMQRLQVAYKNGIHHITIPSIIVKGTHEAAGFSGKVGADTFNKSTPGFFIAFKVAPPQTKGFLGWVLLGIIGLLMLRYGQVVARTGGGLFIIVAVFRIRKAVRYNRKEWPVHYQEWRESWFCSECGNFYRESYTKGE